MARFVVFISFRESDELHEGRRHLVALNRHFLPGAVVVGGSGAHWRSGRSISERIRPEQLV